MTGPTPEPPLLRVVRGEPTAEELAALVAVVSSRAASGMGVPDVRRSAWYDPRRLTRPPIHPGPGGWRASALPR